MFEDDRQHEKFQLLEYPLSSVNLLKRKQGP